MKLSLLISAYLTTCRPTQELHFKPIKSFMAVGCNMFTWCKLHLKDKNSSFQTRKTRHLVSKMKNYHFGIDARDQFITSQPYFWVYINQSKVHFSAFAPLSISFVWDILFQINSSSKSLSMKFKKHLQFNLYLQR